MPLLKRLTYKITYLSCMHRMLFTLVTGKRALILHDEGQRTIIAGERVPGYFCNIKYSQIGAMEIQRGLILGLINRKRIRGKDKRHKFIYYYTELGRQAFFALHKFSKKKLCSRCDVRVKCLGSPHCIRQKFLIEVPVEINRNWYNYFKVKSWG